MADIILQQGQSVPSTMETRYQDMGDGTHALVGANVGTIVGPVNANLQVGGVDVSPANPVPDMVKVVPTVTALHRTITLLDGKYPPLNSDAAWAVNSLYYAKARFFCDVGIRGTTALADDPQLTFRPYVRNGGAGGYVAAGESVSYVRPRLYDNAAIKCQKTADNGANYTDYSAAVIDNNVATYADIDALNTLAQQDWVVIGGPVPFIGAALAMTANVNTNVSAMTIEYWNGAWTALTNLVDGTIAVATKTLSGSGQITWTLPADWIPSTINGITAYYMRFTVSAQLSATVEIAEIDLFFRLRCGIDCQVDGDDVLLMLQTQDIACTGTLVLAGTVRLSWR